MQSVVNVVVRVAHLREVGILLLDHLMSFYGQELVELVQTRLVLLRVVPLLHQKDVGGLLLFLHDLSNVLKAQVLEN